MIKRYENCTQEEKDAFDETVREQEKKEVEYFRSRGFGPMEVAAAGLSFTSFLENEKRYFDSRPFDKAPGFRRMWILGYLYGRNI